MNDEPRRRRAAMRAAGRLLSGARPRTMRERLAALAGAGGLDDLPDCYGGGPVDVLGG